jgi:predicted lipoprotein with Yx(FWY)xxD motif
MVSCQGDTGGLVLPDAGSGGKGGSGGEQSGVGGNGVGGTLAQAGSDEVAGSGNDPTSGTGGGTSSGGKGGGSDMPHTGGTHSTGGSGASGGSADTSGTGGSGDASAEGGAGGEMSSAGAGNTPGEGGAGGSAEEVPASLCIFHSAPSIVGGGEGGAAPAPTGVALGNNAFVGPYLTDLAGMTLYIYGADVPGDCNNPPVSNCTADCTQSWPIFDAGERQLDATLDPNVFGTIDRGNGVFQTTYYGWPLYRYKSDTTPNTINGQGKSKTWFAAEVELPNLMIMRGPVSGGGVKYLSDDRGRTLYSLSGDTVGGIGVAPASACTGACLDAFLPFAPGAVYPVTSIEPHDVALFFRADGGLQTAYKGAPLYYAKSDDRAGTTNGLTLFGGALVTP